MPEPSSTPLDRPPRDAGRTKRASRRLLLAASIRATRAKIRALRRRLTNLESEARRLDRVKR